MGTNCAPLVADLFLFCCEGDFVASLFDVGQAEIIEAFESASGCLGGLLGVGGPCFGGVVDRICPPGLRLGRAGTSDAKAPFLYLHLSISNGFVSSKIYDGRDDFDFDVVGFPFLDGDVPRSASCGVCVSRLVWFAGMSGRVVDFGARDKGLAARRLQRGCRCRGLRRAFSEFCRRRCGLVSKFGVGLRALLRQGLSEPEFYGDLVYKLKKIVGGADFSDQFRKIIVRYKRVGYCMNIMRRSACLVFGPVAVGGFASLFGCTPVGRASDSMVAPTWGCLFWLVWAGAFLSVAWPAAVRLLVFFCSGVPVVLFGAPGVSGCRSQHVSVESSSLLHHGVYLWFVCFAWWSIGGLGGLRAGRAAVCFGPWWGLGAGLGARGAGVGCPWGRI